MAATRHDSTTSRRLLRAFSISSFIFKALLQMVDSSLSSRNWTIYQAPSPWLGIFLRIFKWSLIQSVTTSIQLAKESFGKLLLPIMWRNQFILIKTWVDGTTNQTGAWSFPDSAGIGGRGTFTEQYELVYYVLYVPLNRTNAALNTNKTGWE